MEKGKPYHKTNRIAATANAGNDSNSGSTQIIAQELEKILKLLPMPSKATGSDTYDEMDTS